MLRKKQKLENCIINIDDDDIDFGDLGVGGDMVEDGAGLWVFFATLHAVSHGIKLVSEN